MRPYRIDARRNREEILRVAEKAFIQDPDDVPLEEIARRARLGRATVYRHFPDRRTLGLAVAAQQLKTLRHTVRQKERPFGELLSMVLSLQLSWRPLVRFFKALPVRYQRQYADALVTLLTPAFRRAQADGRLRDDIEPTDLLLIFDMVETAITTATTRPHPGNPTQRIITVILDGFLTSRKDSMT